MSADQAGAAANVLTLRELNRATLARQMLLERETMSVSEAIERLVGLQAQVPKPPYVGLWTRLRDFRREDLTRLVTEHRVVRATLMRATIHLMTAEDYLLLRPALQPALSRSFQSIGGPRRTEGLDVEAIVAKARSFFEELHTFAELRESLFESEPEGDLSALAYAARMRLPLVQVPSGGTWGYSGTAPFTLAEPWLDGQLSGSEDPRPLVLRYLAAFGPAGVRDFQTWSGLSGMKESIETLRPELRSFRDEGGKELFDLPDAPRPSGDVHAPVRFVSDFDNLILSHADRRRVISDECRKEIITRNGIVLATFLVDGFVRGAWKIEKSKRTASLVIEPFEALSNDDRDALAEEGERLVRFVAEPDGAETFDIRFV